MALSKLIGYAGNYAIDFQLLDIHSGLDTLIDAASNSLAEHVRLALLLIASDNPGQQIFPGLEAALLKRNLVQLRGQIADEDAYVTSSMLFWMLDWLQQSTFLQSHLAGFQRVWLPSPA